MPSEQNKELVSRFFEEIVNAQNIERVGDFIAPGYVLQFPGRPPLSRRELPAFLADLHISFPDLHMQVDEAVAEGDTLALVMTMRGTHRGFYQNMSPTGMGMEIHSQAFMRLIEGRIIEHRQVFDRLALLEQLGLAVEDWMPPTRRTTSEGHREADGSTASEVSIEK